GYVVDRHQLQVLADIGVVLLLFEVGIELDLRSLRREPRGILVAVPLQVALSTVVGIAAILLMGPTSAIGAAIIAFSIAISSTVVVVNITRSRRRPVDAVTSRAMIVWGIIQDAVTLFGVAILSALLVQDGAAAAVPVALLRFAVFAAIAFAMHRVVVPWLIRGTIGQPDIFLAITIAVALVTAGAGAVLFGVPVALAAFVAGAVLGMSPEAREARAVVLPFRDLFAIVFFVAVGTLLDPSALAGSLNLVFLALALVALKGVLVYAGARAFGVPGRRPQIAMGLSQIAEFSFVVLGLGLTAGAITVGQFSAVLAAAVLTIAISTVAVRFEPFASPLNTAKRSAVK
ncbi:MAG: hypothetical protein FJ034_08350, partial [Chloroflexi bacterium]|nr:hypothetical protein [Chloroflexota bacterium]